jgi:H+-transporting ATPase
VSQPAAARTGLTSTEAERLLAEFGPNTTEEAAEHWLRSIARHFWSPVPWMLEVTIALQIAVGERIEGAMIAILLLLNVGLGVIQESRANATLALLKQRLSPRVKLRRDDAWIDANAADVVPGDIVQLSLGGIVPADARIVSGSVLLDQSMLTGESVAVEANAGTQAYAGALVRRGEAVAEVTATGARTYFGRTAELVRTAHVESSEQHAVLGVVRALTVLNFVIVIAMVAYAHGIGMTAARIIPLVLTALLSAVPVALPATFSLAAALGARTLAARGVLLTRLTALNEAAMIDVLCADKTGTLTENKLSIAAVRPIKDGLGEADVLSQAAAASSADGQDPIDAAIRAASAPHAKLTVTRFVPFDPAAKMSEADVADTAGGTFRVIKGSPIAVAAVAPMPPAATTALDAFSHAGYRTLAVASGTGNAMEIVGLIAFSDPPRADSRALLEELASLGVRTVMITGDTAETAGTVAHAIGLDGPVRPPGPLPDSIDAKDFAVYAGVFPEDKFRLVKAFQRAGHAVGMCGDGANDAPALRQAQMGIAVSTATDVAKSAAGLVLTEPGLAGIITCVREGRAAFQRVLTYTLSILINKSVTLIVLGAGLLMTGHAVLTPMLQAIWMLAGDFVTMSRAADRARPTPYPNAWRIRELTLAAIPLAATKLVYGVGILAIGWFVLGLNPNEMRTLTFLMLVLAGAATMYALRERGHFWGSRPAWIMLVASIGNAVFVTTLAAGGLLMTPLSWPVVVGLYATTIAFAFLFDQIKIEVRAWLPIDRRP